MNYEPLWHWVKEREAIRVRKEVHKDPHPWTTDEILATYRFCNVRREDDRGTVWVRDNIRIPFASHPALWFMLCIARQINWPGTLYELITGGRGQAWPAHPEFSPAEMTACLNDRKARGEKIYTGAYMISAPPTKGADKQAYIAEHVLGTLWKNHRAFGALFANPHRAPQLREVHERLTRHDGWGPFMAYQAVVDMRFTTLLVFAPDAQSWAAAGPGTIRGLNRLAGRRVEFNLSQEQALSEMRAIYRLVKDATGVEMDFSDVPNILCETDKYLRVKNGEGKPRALYVPGRGS